MLVTKLHISRKQQSGFTLVELIIGVAISSMIFLASSTLIMLLLSSNMRVKQIDILQQTKNDLQAELSNAVRWGQTISITSIAEDDPFDTITVDSVIYRLEDGRIYKNEGFFTSDEVKITSMETHDYSVNSQYKSLEIRIAIENKQFAAVHDEMRLVVSQRPGTVHINNNPPISSPSPEPSPTLLPTPSLAPTPTPTKSPSPTPTSIPSLAVSLTANPSSGPAPLNGVDLKADVSGTATGNIRYRFDCAYNGYSATYEKDLTTMADPYTVVDLCNYPDNGAYKALVRVDRGAALPAYATTWVIVGSGVIPTSTPKPTKSPSPTPKPTKSPTPAPTPLPTPTPTSKPKP